MILANFKEMLRHSFNIEYKHLNHTWINHELSCGCIIAFCTDIQVTNEERDIVKKYFRKISNHFELLKDINKSQDNKKRFLELQEEYEKLQLELRDYIDSKLEKYKMPYGSDFNSDYYNIKIKQDPNCKNRYY